MHRNNMAQFNHFKASFGKGSLKMFFKRLCLAVFLVLAASCAASAGTSESFQKDADIVRLKHLKYYGELIEEYARKAGKYPFQGREKVPVYVFVAHDRQEKYTKPGPPYSHVVVPFSELVKDVESVLGREIPEYFDPQFVPVHKPNFYIYMVADDTYYFAVHVYQPFTFAKKVGENYNKIEISNNPGKESRACAPDALFGSKSFKKELGKKMRKPGFFENRDRQYIHFTKDGAR